MAWLRGLQSDAGLFQTAALRLVGGKSDMSTQGGGGAVGGTDDRQALEDFLGQLGTIGASALLQADLKKMGVLSGGKGIIN